MSHENKLDLVMRKCVFWHELTRGGAIFTATVDGHSCRLHMNNFPEEPLYTLVVDGEARDLDEAPPVWKFPKLA